MTREGDLNAPTLEIDDTGPFEPVYGLDWVFGEFPMTKAKTKTQTNEDIHRVEFDDGNWWDFRKVVTRGMRKRFSIDGIGALDLGKQNGTYVDIADNDQITEYLRKNPEIAARYNIASDDAVLVNGSVAWSFDGPITLEAIDNLPDELTDKVLEEVRALYRPITEEQVKN